MARKYLVVLFLASFFAGDVSGIKAEVAWQAAPAVDIGRKPKDAAISASGDWVYVLTEDGDILIYSSADGQLEDRIHVGDHISFIAAGATDNQLLTGSRKDRTLQILTLEFIKDIDISGAPFIGSADAPVSIVVFMDYECPYCAQLMPMIEQVLERNPRQVKVVYKQFPLKMHKAALTAAAAALAAAREDRFWELHTLMFDDYRNLTDETILDMAVGLGFDRNIFRKQMASPDLLLHIQKDIQDGKAAGVAGIPSVFINGRTLKKRSVAGFQELIDQALKKQAGAEKDGEN